MADTPQLPRLPDPLAGIRDAVDAHRAVTQASKDAGAAVQAAKQQPATATEAQA